MRNPLYEDLPEASCHPTHDCYERISPLTSPSWCGYGRQRECYVIKIRCTPPKRILAPYDKRILDLMNGASPLIYAPPLIYGASPLDRPEAETQAAAARHVGVEPLELDSVVMTRLDFKAAPQVRRGCRVFQKDR